MLGHPLRAPASGVASGVVAAQAEERRRRMRGAVISLRALLRLAPPASSPGRCRCPGSRTVVMPWPIQSLKTYSAGVPCSAPPMWPCMSTKPGQHVHARRGRSPGRPARPWAGSLGVDRHARGSRPLRCRRCGSSRSTTSTGPMRRRAGAVDHGHAAQDQPLARPLALGARRRLGDGLRLLLCAGEAVEREGGEGDEERSLAGSMRARLAGCRRRVSAGVGSGQGEPAGCDSRRQSK